MEATREIYWNISNYSYMYILLIAAAIVFGTGIYKYLSQCFIGHAENRHDHLLKRIKLTLKYLFAHSRLFRYPYSGVFHYLIFMGFFALFIGTLVVFLEADFGIKIMRGCFYLYFQSAALDIAGFLLLIGIIFLAVQRYIIKPDRYKNNTSDLIALIVLLMIVLTGFLTEGLRLSVVKNSWASWSPIGNIIASMTINAEASNLRKIHTYVWWSHLILALGLFAYLPYSKLRHVIFGPMNIFFQSLLPKGVTVDCLNINEADKLGSECLSDFSWKQLFDLEACVECGRCQDVCPVFMSGQDFSPKNVILKLGGRFFGKNRKNIKEVKIVNTLLSDDELWFCRTCRACMDVCPIFVEHIPKFIEVRRFQVMEEANYPASLQNPIQSLELRGHTYKGTMLSRTDWYKGLNVKIVESSSTQVKYLYWIGCTTALNEENINIAKNFSMLLEKANISFGILGSEETCCGEPARRIGNEYLFEEIARKNIELLNSLSVDAIVTNCPHCFNVLKHEYSQFGANLKVYHHTEFLCKMLNDGVIKPNKSKQAKFTYHDPCYLGRYNKIYDKPRRVLNAVTQDGLLEMKKSKERSFCCGGGGGGSWLSEEKINPHQRVNYNRAEQAIKTGASTIITACPFCRLMLENGVKGVAPSEVVKVKDIAELIYENI